MMCEYYQPPTGECYAQKNAPRTGCLGQEDKCDCGAFKCEEKAIRQTTWADHIRSLSNKELFELFMSEDCVVSYFKPNIICVGETLGCEKCMEGFLNSDYNPMTIKLFKDLTLGEIQKICREADACDECSLYIEHKNGYKDCFTHGDYDFYTRPDLWYVPRRLMINDTE